MNSFLKYFSWLLFKKAGLPPETLFFRSLIDGDPVHFPSITANDPVFFLSMTSLDTINKSSNIDLNENLYKVSLIETDNNLNFNSLVEIS